MSILWSFYRRMRGVELRLSPEDAVASARKEAEKRGWPWLEPVSVREDLLVYKIVTGSDMIGGNIYMDVSIEDGSISYASFVSR
jgi:hypothetical protein